MLSHSRATRRVNDTRHLLVHDPERFLLRWVAQSVRFMAHPRNKRSGSIHLVMGPMFAGKTSELLRQFDRFVLAGRKCRWIKSTVDTRAEKESSTVSVIESPHSTRTAPPPSPGHSATHSRRIQGAHFNVSRLTDIPLIHLKGVDVVAIDEGQFFSDLAPFCRKQASVGRTVLVAALDGTFERKPWPSVSELLPITTTATKLLAICPCGADAPFSMRLVADTNTTLVGDSDKYVAACGRCFDQHMNRKLHRRRRVRETFTSRLERIRQQSRHRALSLGDRSPWWTKSYRRLFLHRRRIHVDRRSF